MNERVVRTSGSGQNERTARHYGRAYQCLRCLYKDNLVKIDVKRRMEAHITKYHLSLDEVGHFCRTCNFRCWDRKTLEDHTRFYARHRRMVTERGGEDKDCLVTNKKPYTMGPADYSVLTKEESIKFFQERGAQGKRREEQKTTPIEEEEGSRPVSPEMVECWLSNLEKNLGEEATTPGPLPNEPEETATGGGLVAGSSSGGARQEPLLALPLDLSIPREENILEELLGGPTEGLTPFRGPASKAPDQQTSTDVVDPVTREVRERSPAVSLRRELEGTEQVQPPRKRARTRSPVERAGSRSSSPSSSESSTSSISPEQWQEIGRKIVEPLRRAMERNSEAIRAMDRRLGTMVEYVGAISRACRVIRDTMERPNSGDRPEERRGANRSHEPRRGDQRRH